MPTDIANGESGLSARGKINEGFADIAHGGADNALLRADGTDSTLQSSGVILDNADNMSGVNSLNSIPTKFKRITGLSDAVAATLFTITTVDSADDSGGLTGELHLNATNGQGGSSIATMSGIYHFSISTSNAGTTTLTAVKVVSETASAANSSGNRQIDSITVTLNAVSAFVTEVKVSIDTSGALGATIAVAGTIEVTNNLYATIPVIS